MHYMTVVSLEKSDEPKKLIFFDFPCFSLFFPYSHQSFNILIFSYIFVL